jgi:hypothetical protein
MYKKKTAEYVQPNISTHFRDTVTSLQHVTLTYLLRISRSITPQLVLSQTSTSEHTTWYIYTGHTQKNGAVVIVNTIKTAPFFCVCPIYIYIYRITITTSFCLTEYSKNNILYILEIDFNFF